MEFLTALKIVFGTLVFVASGLWVFRNYIKAWIDKHDEETNKAKRLDVNDNQTEKNRKDIEAINKKLGEQDVWNKKTDDKLERDFILLGEQRTDMKQLQAGQFDTNRSLELISEQIGLVACLLTGDKKAEELIKVIGDSYKDKEKARIVGEK